MYDILAEIAGLTFQGDESYADILPSTNVDLSTDDIVKLTEIHETPLPTSGQTDFIKILREYYPHFTPTQKYISLVLSRGIINMLLRNYTHPDLITGMKDALPVFDIILDERNKHIADAIIDSPNRHIYIHYGALHYSGVLELLKERDNRWKEVSRENFVVIQ